MAGPGAGANDATNTVRPFPTDRSRRVLCGFGRYLLWADGAPSEMGEQVLLGRRAAPTLEPIGALPVIRCGWDLTMG